MIGITGMDPLSLGLLGGGGVNSGKVKKIGILNFRTGDRISMKFDIYKDIVCHSSCFKSPPDLVTLRGF